MRGGEPAPLASKQGGRARRVVQTPSRQRRCRGGRVACVRAISAESQDETANSRADRGLARAQGVARTPSDRVRRRIDFAGPPPVDVLAFRAESHDETTFSRRGGATPLGSRARCARTSLTRLSRRRANLSAELVPGQRRLTSAPGARRSPVEAQTVAEATRIATVSRVGPLRSRLDGRVGASTLCLSDSLDNDPSAGSPTETLLRLLLPLNNQV